MQYKCIILAIRLLWIREKRDLVKLMDTFPIRFTDRQLESLDEMVRQKIYPTASEAVRAAVALLEDKHGIHGKPATPATCEPVLVAS